MAEAMENEFQIQYLKFSKIGQLLYGRKYDDNSEYYQYVDSMIEATLDIAGQWSDTYKELKAQCWWLHCSILVSLTDEQIENFKESFMQ
jgi:hypothetical protein